MFQTGALLVRRCCPAFLRWNYLYVDRFGIGIEKNSRFAAPQLRKYVGDLLFERIILLAVIGALAQHERLDDALQRSAGKFGVRNDDGFLRFLAAEFLTQAGLLQRKEVDFGGANEVVVG